MEIIIDTNADIDRLLQELHRVRDSVKKMPRQEGSVARRELTWKDVYCDATIQSLFPERLSSVMSAAKIQRAIHFTKELLLMQRDDETEIDILAPHLRILPESAIRGKSKQEERKAAFKEAKIKALEGHKEKMLSLVMMGLDFPRAKPKQNVKADEAHSSEKEQENVGDLNSLPPPPPPPPPMETDDEDEDDLPPPPPPPDEEDGEDDNDSDEDDSDSNDDDDDDPPPPPPPLLPDDV